MIIFEELVQDPRKTVRDILRFLDIDSEPPDNVGKAYNAYAEPLGNLGMAIVRNKPIKKVAKVVLPGSTARTLLRTILNKKGKKPQISEEKRTALEELYKDDVRKLESLLGRTLPWPTAARQCA